MPIIGNVVNTHDHAWSSETGVKKSGSVNHGWSFSRSATFGNQDYDFQYKWKWKSCSTSLWSSSFEDHCDQHNKDTDIIAILFSGVQWTRNDSWTDWPRTEIPGGIMLAASMTERADGVDCYLLEFRETHTPRPVGKTFERQRHRLTGCGGWSETIRSCAIKNLSSFLQTLPCKNQ